jgi:hypothetical protein
MIPESFGEKQNKRKNSQNDLPDLFSFISESFGGKQNKRKEQVRKRGLPPLIRI